MTDEQLLEGMEWYLRVAQRCGSATLSEEVISGLFNLVKNQKTEIEILIRKKEILRDEIAEKDEELERMTDEACRYHDLWHKLQRENDALDLAIKLLSVEEIKSEAYREFAERIYKFFCNKQNWNVFKDQWLENGECSWLKENINNLLKELTEKNDKE